MAVDSQLTLFGLDLRKVPQFWRAGWQELLWAPNAYGRQWVDEAVTATFSNEGRKSYLAGEEVALGKTKAQAYVLPEDLVLDTQLNLPASVALDLESMLALEVRSKSPFPEEDTRYGWHIEQTNDERLKIDLVIVSHQLVLQHLQQREAGLFDNEDLWLRNQEIEIDEEERSWLQGKTGKEEIWAMVDNNPIVIQGFAENARNQRYQKRMKRVLAGLFYSFLMLCALVAVAMIFKTLQIQQRESEYEQAQQNSLEAVALRDELVVHNTRVAGINKLIEEAYNPYSQLSNLSKILEDDTWIASLDIKKHKMRLDGRSANAVALMEFLSNQPEYLEVVAPVAITQGGKGQGERFVFEISLKPMEVAPLEIEAVDDLAGTDLKLIEPIEEVDNLDENSAPTTEEMTKEIAPQDTEDKIVAEEMQAEMMPAEMMPAEEGE